MSFQDLTAAASSLISKEWSQKKIAILVPRLYGKTTACRQISCNRLSVDIKLHIFDDLPITKFQSLIDLKFENILLIATPSSQTYVEKLMEIGFEIIEGLNLLLPHERNYTIPITIDNQLLSTKSRTIPTK
jgi:hypothetical protein